MEKELQVLIDSANSKLDSLEKSVSAKADMSVLETKFKEIQESIAKLPASESVKTMQDQLDVIDIKLQAIQVNSKEGQKGLGEQLKDVLTGDAYKAACKSRTPFEFEIKSNELSTTNSFTETNGPVIQRMYEPSIVSAPQRPTPIWDAIAKKPTSSDYVIVTERTSQTIGAARVAEVAVFPQSYGAWTTYKYGVIKIAEYLKVAREKLEDWDQVRAEIMDMLTTNIPHIREGYFLTGYYSTENFLGLINTTAQVAKDFAKPTGLQSVTQPNNVDVLRAAALQVFIGNSGSLANKQGYNANIALINPVDLANIQLIKNVDGSYVMPPFAAADGTTIYGMRVVPTLYMTAGKFLVGDFNQMTAYLKRGLSVQMWDQNDTDPIYDLVTFTASHRLALHVGATKAFAFVYGDFDDAVSLIGA